jgi:hypothetical protein
MKIHGLGGVTGERANGIDESSIPEERAAHGGTDGIGAAFVLLRLCLLHHLRELKEAHEQGLALDMAMAANALETAAIAMAANVRDLLMCKASLETWAQAVRYECHALQHAITDLFEACLCPSPLDVAPWLRESLAHHAAQIERILSTCDE